MTVSKKKTSKKKTGGTQDRSRMSSRDKQRELNSAQKREVTDRAAMNRIIRQDDLREKIHNGKILGRIDKINTELLDIVKMSKSQRVMTRNEHKKLNVRLKALKQYSENNLRLLNKVIGDEKSLEFRNPEGKDPFLSLATAMKMALDGDDEEEGGDS